MAERLFLTGTNYIMLGAVGLLISTTAAATLLAVATIVSGEVLIIAASRYR